MPFRIGRRCLVWRSRHRMPGWNEAETLRRCGRLRRCGGVIGYAPEGEVFKPRHHKHRPIDEIDIQLDDLGIRLGIRRIATQAYMLRLDAPYMDRLSSANGSDGPPSCGLRRQSAGWRPEAHFPIRLGMQSIILFRWGNDLRQNQRAITSSFRR